MNRDESQEIRIEKLQKRVEELERELREAPNTGEARGRRIASAEIANQLKNYDSPGFLGDVSDAIYMEALRIENMGFEEAHQLRDCGHSRGDFRDANYGTPEYKGDEACVACAELKSLRELAKMVIYRAGREHVDCDLIAKAREILEREKGGK